MAIFLSLVMLLGVVLVIGSKLKKSRSAPAPTSMEAADSARKLAGRILLGLAVVIAVAIGMAIAKFSGSVPPAPPQSKTPVAAASFYPVSVPPGTVMLTAEQLETSYRNNEVATDSVFKGKSLLVSGQVDLGFKEDNQQNIYLDRASPALGEVSLSFRSSEKSKLASLFDGDGITVLCRGAGSDNPSHPEFGIPQLADCLLRARQPSANAILADQIRATLVGGGVNLDKYSYSSGTIVCSINTGEWFTVGPAGLRNHLSGPLQALYALSNKFPQIQEIEVDLESPAAPEKDEYGHDLPASMSLTAFLRIHTADLRKFPGDFDWNLYPVYVANRYIPSITSVNWSLRDTGTSELSEETRLGGFQDY